MDASQRIVKCGCASSIWPSRVGVGCGCGIGPLGFAIVYVHAYLSTLADGTGVDNTGSPATLRHWQTAQKLCRLVSLGCDPHAADWRTIASPAANAGASAYFPHGRLIGLATGIA